MSGREWKPGDVASLVLIKDEQPFENRAIRTETGRWLTGRHLFAFRDDQVKVRPLVVIDPESREQVERLRLAINSTEDMQAALREFANPPKPEEPTGLGAVVEDADGERWVRMGTTGMDDWRRAGFAGGGRGAWHSYADIAAVRVLSEGWSDE